MGNLKAIIQADTTGFKKSIEDATKVLENYVGKQNEAVNATKAASGVTDEQVNSYKRVVNQLNKVNSGTMSTTQQEKALVQQIKELKIQWQGLNDTAKQSDFGKALSNSSKAAEQQLSQLRAQMKSVSEGSTSTATKIGGLESQFGSVLGVVGKFAGAIGVATTALTVAKDAFLSTETNVDLWEKTVSQAETAYRVFCNTLNNGNWSNFFKNLNDAIEGAGELYEKLDRLGSIKSNNKAAIAIQEQALAQLRLRKQQGENVDAQIKAVEERLQYLRGQEVKAGKDAGIAQIKQAIKEQYGDVGEANLDVLARQVINQGQTAFDFYDKELDRLKAKIKTVQVDDVMVTPEGVSIVTKKLVEDMSALTAKEKEQLKIYQAFHDAEAGIAQGVETYANAVQQASTATKEQFRINRYLGAGSGNKGGGKETTTTKVKVDTKEAKTALQQLKDELKELENQRENINIDAPDASKLIDDINAQIKAKQDRIDAVEIALKIKEPKVDTPKPVEVKVDPQIGSIGYLENQLKDLRGQFELAVSPESREQISKQIKSIEEEIQTLSSTKLDLFANGMDGFESMIDASETLYESWSSLGENFEEMNFAERFFAITDAIFGTIDAINSFAEGAKSMISMIKSISAASTAASKKKLAENTAEQASNSATTTSELGTAAAKTFSAHSSIPWVGIAIAIGLIGMMMAAMASFHNGGIVGKYANGGVIPKYAGGGMISAPRSLGDMNIARVNSGEMILNGRQQANLFKLLDSSNNINSGMSGGSVDFRISGDTLYGVLRNHSKVNSTIGKNIGLN